MSIKTIENMINWIEENITRKPTLTEMSNYVGYSPFYCSTKFRENVGITFKQYLSKRRLSIAAIEVKNTKLRFLDIALKYGFSSQEAFTRAFVDNYGCTPKQYRMGFNNAQLNIKSNVLPVLKDENCNLKNRLFINGW